MHCLIFIKRTFECWVLFCWEHSRFTLLWESPNKDSLRITFLKFLFHHTKPHISPSHSTTFITMSTIAIREPSSSIKAIISTLSLIFFIAFVSILLHSSSCDYEFGGKFIKKSWCWLTTLMFIGVGTRRTWKVLLGMCSFVEEHPCLRTQQKNL